MTRVPGPEGAILLVAALLIGSIVPFVSNGSGRSESSAPADLARLLQNRAIIAQCEKNATSCIGGFVVLDRGIMQIRSCAWCTDYGVDVHGIGMFAEQGRIIPPNDSRWESTAILYMRQWVDKKKP